MYDEEERAPGRYGIWGHEMGDLQFHSLGRPQTPRTAPGGGVLLGTDGQPIKRLIPDHEVVWEMGIDS